jgi:AcrR family transcriptional regulator/predicted ester cyclase
MRRRDDTVPGQESKPLSRVRRTATDRKRQITDACLEIIAARGFSSASVREISRRSGISIGTLLHHFETKDDILYAAIDEIAATWDKGAQAILEGSGRPLERLHRYIDWVLGDEEYDYLWRVFMAFWHEAVFDPQTKASILEGNKSQDELIAACVSEAISLGELGGDDPDHIGKTLTTTIDGVAIHIHGRLGRWDRKSGIALCKEVLDQHSPGRGPPRLAHRRDRRAADNEPTGDESEQSKEIVATLVDAWNSQGIERICSFFHDDFENWQAPLPTVRGLSNYREHLRTWFTAYPDLRLEIVTLFAEGELVCLETRATGSPAGLFFNVEPTAAAGINRALDILELRDGKVWRERGYWDFSLFSGQPSPLSNNR